MIKKRQKWIALLVAVTFAWLLQVSTMPLQAADTIAPASSERIEQGPDYYEAVGQKADPAKKKSILPYIVIGAGLLAVTAVVLFLVVLKSSYDITGTWNFIITFGGASTTPAITFVGDKKSGSFSCSVNPNLSGIYEVDGKKVNLILTVKPSIPFSGQFSDKNTMNGTMTEGSNTYTWTATRQ